MDPFSWVFGLLGLGLQGAGMTGQAVTAWQAGVAEEKLAEEAAAAKKEAFNRQWDINAEKEKWAVADINTQANKAMAYQPEVSARRGTLFSSIHDKAMTELSQNLAKTLERRAKSFGMAKEYGDWALSTEAGLNAEQTANRKKYGEQSAGWGTLGDIGSITTGYGQWRAGVQQSEKINKIWEELS
jgi:hypothetical protein